MTPNVSIMDAFEDAFDDNDDGFTTIKDLAERGITKMEPLDYDDFYLGAYDNDILRSYVRVFIHYSKGKEVRKWSFSHHNFFQKIKLVHEKNL